MQLISCCVSRKNLAALFRDPDPASARLEKPHLRGMEQVTCVCRDALN